MSTHALPLGPARVPIWHVGLLFFLFVHAAVPKATLLLRGGREGGGGGDRNRNREQGYLHVSLRVQLWELKPKRRDGGRCSVRARLRPMTSHSERAEIFTSDGANIITGAERRDESSRVKRVETTTF